MKVVSSILITLAIIVNPLFQFASVHAISKHISKMETVPLNTFLPFLKKWVYEKSLIRDEINGNLMESSDLPSDDLGTSQFNNDFYAVIAEYKVMKSYSLMFNKQTSDAIIFYNHHHFNRGQLYVDRAIQAMDKINRDCGMITDQLRLELQGDYSLIKQINAGSTNPSVPYWTFTAWNIWTNDEVQQTNVFNSAYAEILKNTN